LSCLFAIYHAAISFVLNLIVVLCVPSLSFSLSNLVKVRPKFDQVPKDTKTGVGLRAEFHCSTRGYSESVITWNKLSNHVTGMFDLITISKSSHCLLFDNI